MTRTRSRRFRSAIGLLLAGSLIGVTAPWTSSQEAPPDDPPADELPELPPAPPGLTAELSSIYSTAHAVVANVTALVGEPPAAPDDPGEPPESPAEFNDRVAELTSDDLALLNAAIVEVPSWADVEPGLVDLERETELVVEVGQALEQRGVELPAVPIAPAMLAASASTDGLVEPPPPPFIPSSEVVPGEFTSCPASLIGGHQGNDVILTATVMTTAVKIVLSLIPKELIIAGQQFENPIAFVISAVVELLDLAVESLSFAKDIYMYCEGENQYSLNFNTENTLLVLYELMQRTDRTLANVNDGVIAVSGQLHHLQSTTDEVLTIDLHEALAAPADGVPDVAYQLPASEGGFLDSEPIGVQAVVTAALASAQRAGLPVNSAAPSLLAMADDALDRGRYADAFRLYQAAYQELGR